MTVLFYRVNCQWRRVKNPVTMYLSIITVLLSGLC